MKSRESLILTFFISLLIVESVQSSIVVPTVTIYIHGTTTSIGLRLLGRFCKDVAFGNQGMHHINMLPEVSLLKKDAQALAYSDSKRFDAAHFYTFGWSGALSFKARKKAGMDLYQGVKELLLRYQKRYGCLPKVQILTFSHGGNVALSMVEHLPFFQDHVVHLELILVAVPVQKVTEKLIEHEQIAKSYVISSTRDLLQVVDFYKHEKKYHTPKRFFNTSCQNCHQVKVLINGRGIGHIELLRAFMIHLPYVLKFADSVNVDDQSSFVFDKDDSIGDLPTILNCRIQDDQFCFYNVFNLIKVVRGERKKVKLAHNL